MTLRVTFTVTLPEGPLSARTPFDELRLMVLSETAALIGPPVVPSILIPPPLLFLNDEREIETFMGTPEADVTFTPAPLPVTTVSSIFTLTGFADPVGATRTPEPVALRMVHFSMFTCLALRITMPETERPAKLSFSTLRVSPRRVTTSWGPAMMTMFPTGVPAGPDASQQMEAVPETSFAIVMDLLISRMPKSPVSMTLICPPAVVQKWAAENVLQGAVR